MNIHKIKNYYFKFINKIFSYNSFMVLLLLILIISIIFATTLGTVHVTIKEICIIEIYHIFGVGDSNYIVNSVNDDIIWNLRMPRVILAVTTGMGLAVAGTVMQATVRNVLADPYILGLSSGASLGATLSIMIGIGAIFGWQGIGFCAFAGALFSSFLVLELSGRTASPLKLLLSGMVISAICSAFASFVIFFANNREGMQTITYWLMGSLGNASWNTDIILLLLVIFISLLFQVQARILDLMLLGDETTITLGINIGRYRKFNIICTSILIGAIVSVTGMIGFVGLIIPHCMRSFVGSTHRYLIPATAIAGAIFLIWADVLSRILMNGAEIPIGVLVSVIAAPFFIYLVMKKGYGFGG